MIDSLYNVTRKGWLKALSFILAAAMVLTILLNSQLFAHYFGGRVPYLVMIVFYGMTILWIHGIGFEIKHKIWRLIFLPLIGYAIVLPTLIFLMIKQV